jgi:hypothetical protein
VVLLQSRPETVWTRRRTEPVATPRARAVDHIFEQLGRVNQVSRVNQSSPVNPAASAAAAESADPADPITGPER